MHHHGDPALDASVDDSAAKRAVVERAHGDLHGCDRRELERLVQLASVHVRDPDARDEAVVDELRQSPDGRAQRPSRIGCVEDVEVDRVPVERGQARLAVGPKQARPAVRHPRAARSRHASLRDDPGSFDAAERASQERLAPFVGTRRVEEGDPRVDSRGDRLERVRLQAHAPEPDAKFVGPEPRVHQPRPLARTNSSSLAASSSSSRRAVRGSGENGAS